MCLRLALESVDGLNYRKVIVDYNRTAAKIRDSIPRILNSVGTVNIV